MDDLQEVIHDSDKDLQPGDVQHNRNQECRNLSLGDDNVFDDHEKNTWLLFTLNISK